MAKKEFELTYKTVSENYLIGAAVKAYRELFKLHPWQQKLVNMMVHVDK